MLACTKGGIIAGFYGILLDLCRTQGLQEEEKRPGTGAHCTHVRRGAPEKFGVIRYYRILSVYRP